MNIWYRDSDADFQPLDVSTSKKLLSFINSRKFVTMDIPKIEINGLTYIFEYRSINYNSRLKSRSNSFYYRQGDNIVRISDHWSRSQYPLSKKLNCGFIASCYWTNLDGVRFTKGSSYYIGGICPLNKFKYKRTVEV